MTVGSGPDVGVGYRVAVQGPAAFVNEAVVEGTEPRGVGEDAGPVVAAEDDVVEFGDPALAVGERAATAVTDPGGAALRDGELVVGLADVEHFAVAAEDDRDDLGVAGEPACGLRADLRAVGQPQPLLPELVSRVSSGMVMITVRGAPLKLGVWWWAM